MAKQGEDYSQEIGWLLKEKYDGVDSPETQADIERIKQDEPVAYVIGFVDFLGCRIDLSQRPLIPRPETEFWVEQVIADVKHRVFNKVRCLDMFAGSGCIGLGVLKNVPTATVDFVDSEDMAIEQITINCESNNIDPSRYRIIKSDIFENIKGTYDYILANPPYIAEGKKDEVEESVLVHEPHEALFGGSNGLILIETFLDQVKKYLNRGAKVYMEFGKDQKDEIEKILIDRGYSNFNFHRDQFGEWRSVELSPLG